MRITNKIIQNNSITNINNNKVMEDKLNTQLATGKKVNRPSDDPVVAIRALRLRTSLSEVEQYYTKNVPDAKSWLSITENAVKSVTDVITSMYEDFTSGAAGFKTPEDREAILENLKGLRDEYYSIGNADYAGRHVFTGYRTDTSFTFTEDTTAEYSGIKDNFNASDVGRVTYVEGTLIAEDVNSLTTEGNEETTVKEDRVNRIRLSYDNINGSARKGVTIGFNGDQSGNRSGRVFDLYNEDGSLKDKDDPPLADFYMSGTDPSDPYGNTVLKFNDPLDYCLTPIRGSEYARRKIEPAPSVAGTETEVSYDGQLYTIKKDSAGTFTVDNGAAIVDNGDGTLTLTIPDTASGDDTVITIKDDGSAINGAEKGGIDVSADTGITGNKIKIACQGIYYNIAKDASGNYTVDNNSTIKKNGDGTLTVTVPGPGGTSDVYTEIRVKADGSDVVSAYKCVKIVGGNFWPDDTNYGGIKEGEPNSANISIYTTTAEDTTSLIYRTELSGVPSIPSSSITVDPADGLQSFKIKNGTQEYTIKKFADEDRYFAVDSSGNAIENIKVTEKSDKTLEVSVGNESRHYDSTQFDVFNVSADGRSILSAYHENVVEVKITDSTAAVAADADGNNLTAYQYLALDDDNKNAGDAADAVYLLADTGELVFGSNIAKTLSNLKDIDGVDTISVIYDKSEFEKGDIRPEHYFDSKLYDEKHLIQNPLIYDEQDQEINYTIGTNQSIRINTNASEVFDPQVARVLDDIINNIEEVKAAEEKVNRLKGMKADTATYGEADQKKIDILLDSAQKALTFLTDKLQKQFEGGLTSSQGFLDKANTALTAIGNRSARVDLVENRLQSQSTNFKTLSSENEDADITEVAVQLSSAEMSYQGALMATGKIAQTSLLNYL